MPGRRGTREGSGGCGCLEGTWTRSPQCPFTVSFFGGRFAYFFGGEGGFNPLIQIDYRKASLLEDLVESPWGPDPKKKEAAGRGPMLKGSWRLQVFLLGGFKGKLKGKPTPCLGFNLKEDTPSPPGCVLYLPLLRE